jgi:beta-lactamase regulating signal transducer with metallopeptidase domain
VSTVVYIPFVASLMVALLTRVVGHKVWPRAAVWAMVTASTALAVSSVGALLVLASPVAAQVPLVATVGRWRPAAIASRSPVPLAVSLLAVVVLATLAYRLGRELYRVACDVRGVAGAHRSAVRARHGDLVVTDEEAPYAHALPGLLAGGTVVVSSGLLALLDDDERTAVLAHERSHLRHRHALFELVVQLAVALNPLLIGLRDDVAFAVERWADEDAASSTDRSVAASALARTALRALTAPVKAAPGAALALHSHRAAARIVALLDPSERRDRPAWLLLAASAAAAVAFALALHDTERFFEAARVWSHR